MPFLPEGAWIPSFISNIVILYICAFSFVSHYLQHLNSSYHCLAAMLLLGNFGPRSQHLLGTGDHINMPENTPQSPSYSILKDIAHIVVEIEYVPRERRSYDTRKSDNRNGKIPESILPPRR